MLMFDCSSDGVTDRHVYHSTGRWFMRDWFTVRPLPDSGENPIFWASYGFGQKCAAFLEKLTYPVTTPRKSLAMGYGSLLADQFKQTIYPHGFFMRQRHDGIALGMHIGNGVDFA